MEHWPEPVFLECCAPMASAVAVRCCFRPICEAVGLRLCPAASGQILERINGKSVSAIISNREWHDIRYLRTMLLTVWPMSSTLKPWP